MRLTSLAAVCAVSPPRILAEILGTLFLLFVAGVIKAGCTSPAYFGTETLVPYGTSGIKIRNARRLTQGFLCG
jgi:hypothetical protein